MSFASGPGASIQPEETKAVGSSPALRGRGPSSSAAPQRTRRDVMVQCCILAALIFAYGASFSTLHGVIDNRAFLLGLGICLLAAAWLGARGALVVIVSVALIDRDLALRLPPSPETGLIAGIIALLVKLVLAGGLGLVMDSRRRALALNAELHREI